MFELEKFRFKEGPEYGAFTVIHNLCIFLKMNMSESEIQTEPI